VGYEIFPKHEVRAHQHAARHQQATTCAFTKYPTGTMHIFDLPPETLSHIIDLADLSPRGLRKIVQTTKTPNPLSLVATDDRHWRRWTASPHPDQYIVPDPPKGFVLPGEQDREPGHLCDAFSKNLREKDPMIRKIVGKQYAGYERQSPFKIGVTVDDGDFELVTAYRSIDCALAAHASLLIMPHIARQFLGKPEWLERNTPHLVLAQQNICRENKLPIPQISLSRDYWARFSSTNMLEEEARTGLHAQAMRRWEGKSNSVREAIAEASKKTTNTELFHISNDCLEDFDYAVEFCCHPGASITKLPEKWKHEPSLSRLIMQFVATEDPAVFMDTYATLNTHAKSDSKVIDLLEQAFKKFYEMLLSRPAEKRHGFPQLQVRTPERFDEILTKITMPPEYRDRFHQILSAWPPCSAPLSQWNLVRVELYSDEESD
jgi:hypothetical protein